ncbi:acyltransferase domain-containing protein [Paenibacillus peoriae]|uniref:ACP S-malonyltransferase n=1 Tax=Paenibacillus peoriae TaxID=59893 RepID=UPI0003078763|nr:acyltransferase domain-containing protein [Paenibacillus peoriae]MEC0182539.1 acyltransferase domain-containing protein [Paenibacillus peoriae]
MKKATSIIGTELRDDEEAMGSTVWIQTALFVKETAIACQLIEQGIRPQFVAGHSIGAFPAAVIAGVLSFEDALRIVWLRARLMEAAFPAGYGMGVIMGLTKAEVQQAVLLSHSEAAPVYLSNINAEQQIVLSGSLAGLNKAFMHAKKLGAAKTALLKVPIPSHSPLMSEVANKLLLEIRTFSLRDAQIPYLVNHTGRKMTAKEKIAEDLALNVAYPVQWMDMAAVCVESGADCFIEMPPGNTLSRLVKQAHKDTRQISVCEIGLEATQYLIRKWKEQEE